MVWLTLGTRLAARLGDILTENGLKVAQQRYSYSFAGNTVSGTNVYAILRGPRADATEAIVLIAAWRNMDDEYNYSGVALALTLARYFKRWSLWSKDIIILIPSESRAGPQAWIDAYHDAHHAPNVESLPIKSGALQGAVALDYTADTYGRRFGKLHILYDGVNGQLPNLDLFNTAVQVASGQNGLGSAIQRMFGHKDTYKARLQTILRGMLNQGLGHATGPHSVFMPYHVDAITLQAVGDGWHDEITLGRVTEGIFRSLNNLLEHLHQSFFFYLLMQANRFVSIGTYLPAAMIVAANFSIMSIALWVKSGRAELPRAPKVGSTESREKDEPKLEIVRDGEEVALVPVESKELAERKLTFPLAFISLAHFLGLAPLYAFNYVPEAVGPSSSKL